MTSRHFCTYFDHNYLPRGMVMLESLHEYCPQAHVHVLCLSEECHTALAKLDYPHVTLNRLGELETADKELFAVKNTRSLIEYYFTITPCLPWHLLTVQGLSEITYLDADMLFFSSPEPLFNEAGDASVILTPHRFPDPLKHLEVYGLFNVSWLTFRNTESGRACLAWYRDACLAWCGDRLENGRFADQKYLDHFPGRFGSTHAIRHPGAGLAPWNMSDAQVEEGEGGFSTCGVPLVFYHAQGFKRILGPFYSSGLLEYGVGLESSGKRRVLAFYAKKYLLAEQTASRLLGKNTIVGVRGDGRRISPLSTAKMTIQEWYKKTLVVQYP
ncbi:MAG: glycosyl transferase [Desulfovibrio sp.]|jgi:hypothetical protein|nr:glycosyl transferase [Desulfovibrio sp.]